LHAQQMTYDEDTTASETVAVDRRKPFKRRPVTTTTDLEIGDFM
jgi:hypothetical protein